MKPNNLIAFLGDSILIQVAVFTDNDQPYSLYDNKVDDIAIVFPKLGGLTFSGSSTGKNTFEIFIPAGYIRDPGVFSYFISIANVERGIRHTIAFGKLTVKIIPE